MQVLLAPGRDGELSVQFVQEDALEERVGLGHVVDAPQPQFLRQTALPSPVTALHPASRLRRIGRDHLNPQFLQSPSHLRQMMGIHLLAGFWRHEKVRAAVAV